MPGCLLRPRLPGGGPVVDLGVALIGRKELPAPLGRCMHAKGFAAHLSLLPVNSG